MASALIITPTYNERDNLDAHLSLIHEHLPEAHILIVDDDAELLQMIENLLRRIGYQVTVKSSALEAFACFCNAPDQYDLIITDQIMPGMTGTELAQKIFMVKSKMPIILFTGYSSGVSRQKVLDMGIRELAFKPLAFDKLSRLVRQIIDDAS